MVPTDYSFFQMCLHVNYMYRSLSNTGYFFSLTLPAEKLRTISFFYFSKSTLNHILCVQGGFSVLIKTFKTTHFWPFSEALHHGNVLCVLSTEDRLGNILLITNLHHSLQNCFKRLPGNLRICNVVIHFNYKILPHPTFWQSKILQ